ncbi:MAG: type 4a pilus biogenesis protein PilO [Candidatus Omnitrophota bacterium]|nr:type 4a pilus biogenesis protein PilO [Candidatus Omnitrophota bacterium]
MSPAAPIKPSASSSILSQISAAKSQMGRTQQLLLVTLGVGLLTLAIGVLMIQVPWQERRQQLASRTKEENERSELLLVIQRQETELKEIESTFLLKGGATGLASQISDLAAQSGLQIDSVTPQSEVVAEPYTRFQLEILATGNLANLMRFLRTLEDHRPLLWVEQLDVEEPSKTEKISSSTAQDQPKIRLLIGAVALQKVSG